MSRFVEGIKSWRLPRLHAPEKPGTLDYVKFALKIRKAWKSTLAAAITMVIILSLGTYVGHKVIHSNVQRALVDKKRAERQRRRKSQFDSLQMRVEKRQMSDEEVERIISLSIGDLQKALLSGDLTPIEVLTAYQIMALRAHEKTNCLVEPIFQAEEWAEALEDISKEERGPLYGIPVSIKENVSLEGYDTTEGNSKLIGCPVQEDCSLAAVLKALGAVPFVRTNMPQLGFSHESSNPIFGATVNPYNPLRSPGGSSSGEGALIGLGGSPIGFGTDTAGSIRCPAALCGVCGIKPTAGRISNKGRPDFNGQTLVLSLAGPMARDVDSLVVAMRALCASQSGLMHSLDPFCPIVPFNDQVYNSKERLKIGVLRYDGACHTVPGSLRVLDKAVSILQEAGHEVVEWTFPGLGEAFWWNIKAQCGDSGARLLKAVEFDNIDHSLKLQSWAALAPVWVKKLGAKLISFKLPWTARCMEATSGVWSALDWWDLTCKIQNLREQVADSWREKGLNAIVTPAMATQALPINSSSEALYISSYIMLFNTLNFPAGVVPVDMSSDEDTASMVKDYIPANEAERSIKKKLLRGAEGLPLGVQCASLPWEEEVCLRVMKEVEDGIKKHSH